MQKIVSTLGLGRYNPTTQKYEYERVRYRWGEQEFETNLIQQAWSEWFPDAQVLVLATERARQERRDDLEGHPHWKVVEIPDGKNESEFWGIYEQMVANLDEGDEVILDITHGFRSLPVLILLAASFLRSARGVTISHLLYGAYEAKVGDHTPVFDLAPFLTMLDWASATNRFLEIGDVRKLAQVTGVFEGELKSSIKHLEDFSLSLQLHFPLQAGQAAADSVAALHRVKERLPPPMRVLEERLIRGIAPLAFNEECPPESQLAALFQQIKWYLRYRHHEKALGLAKEWIHLLAKWKFRDDKDIWSPDLSLKNELDKHQGEKWAVELKDLYEEITNLRNKISHWQLNKRDNTIQPLDARKVPEESESLIHRLESLATSMGLTLVKSP
jgi:CRISPR-associated DxTHG motif protein